MKGWGLITARFSDSALPLMINVAPCCYVTLDGSISLFIYLFICVFISVTEACYLWRVVKDVGFGSDARGQKYRAEVSIMETQTYPQPHGARPANVRHTHIGTHHVSQHALRRRVSHSGTVISICVCLLKMTAKE